MFLSLIKFTVGQWNILLGLVNSRIVCMKLFGVNKFPNADKAMLLAHSLVMPKYKCYISYRLWIDYDLAIFKLCLLVDSKSV